MTFLHPWALWLGAAAAAAPVIIHWLTRPRPVRRPLSTLRFVREAIREHRARHRLRDFVLLALRTAAIALLAFTLARPQWGSQPLVSDLTSGSAVRVVLVDVSQSMAAVVDGVEQLEQAKAVAANRYLRYRPGLGVNLVLAGATPRAVFDSPSTNFEALREELSRCRALPERLDVKAALEAAGRMLAPSGPEDRRRRELVLISDFQRSNWTRADFSSVPADTQIELESTAPRDPPPNLAILDAEVSARGAQTDRAAVRIEVGNFTPQPRKVTVEVVLGDVTRRLEAVCPPPPNPTTVLSGEMELRGEGWQWGEARLVGVEDALAADNTRPLAIEIRGRPTYHLVTREAAERRPSSSHFMECALAPEARRREEPRAAAASVGAPLVVRSDPANLAAKSLAAADLIVLDHPGKLSDEAVEALAGLLRRGHPVLYVAAEWIDAANLKRLVQVAGSGLQMPVEFVPPPAGQSRRNLVLKSVRQDASPFRVFGDSLGAAVGSLRFAGGLGSRRLARGLADDVLATYNDGSASLVFTDSDAGALAVLNADLMASNIASSAAFVPLVGELVERMLGRNRRAGTAVCGEPLVARLPGEASPAAGLRIVGPGKRGEDASGGRFGELVEDAAGTVWHWAAPDQPGVYRIQRDGKTLFAIAVQLPAEESDLRPFELELLKTRLASGHDVHYRAAAEGQPSDDAWNWFAAACALCLLGELVGLLAFRT
jgi:hypothetical protein